MSFFPLKIIVAGTRTFNDYDLLSKTLDEFFKRIVGSLEIVSGWCEGAVSFEE